MAKGSAAAGDVEIDRDVCKLVHQFVQRLDAHVRRVADDLGMTASQVVALRELSDPITARELAARMACEASNATFVLDRLERQDLIERRPHPTDRRAKQIVLTPAGERARAGVLARLETHSPLAPLSGDQQESFRDLLQALLADR
ncbi:MarR family winged helix-turn-helix transcriptional regulator [Actinomadura opuntiae]|uniref:MarR family winged helix-turn-helix transcriptional regulator n=1 Tax=Actinomadura sp. OS1-43 TaxID=604315 RepID=UPI00255AA959|nr:MarR family transcriptional regulator [Actinomadura sp. OS1-43]MDL4820986.1 MarR family transcriptional regulator [Actinomadura sp. OS1-43]